MPKTTSTRTTILLLILLAIVCGGTGIVAIDAFAEEAPDTAALAKEIDKNLRAAERDMFNGKNESADQQLQAIALQIEQLAGADPENAKLKSLQSKYDRTRKSLDRKLGVTSTVSGTPSSAAPRRLLPQHPLFHQRPHRSLQPQSRRRRLRRSCPGLFRAM